MAAGEQDVGTFHFMRTFSAQLGHLHISCDVWSLNITLTSPSLIFRDCTVRVWHLSPGDPSLVKELSGHSELVHYVAIDQVPFLASKLCDLHKSDD